MTSRYRAHMINSLSGFKNANIIAIINKAGITNVAIISSVVNLGASTALVGFIMRPNKVERHTLENIQETQQYTINQVSDSFLKAAHETSAKYYREEYEFEKIGLTKTFIDGVDALFFDERQLKYSLTLQDLIPISANNTYLSK